MVVVNFFASWCLPCRDEQDDLSAAAEAFARQEVTVVEIVYQDTAEAAVAFLNEFGSSDSAVYLLDPGGRAAIAFGVFGIPETFFVDRDRGRGREGDRGHRCSRSWDHHRQGARRPCPRSLGKRCWARPSTDPVTALADDLEADLGKRISFDRGRARSDQGVIEEAGEETVDDGHDPIGGDRPFHPQPLADR